MLTSLGVAVFTWGHTIQSSNTFDYGALEITHLGVQPEQTAVPRTVTELHSACGVVPKIEALISYLQGRCSINELYPLPLIIFSVSSLFLSSLVCQRILCFLLLPLGSSEVILSISKVSNTISKIMTSKYPSTGKSGTFFKFPILT